MSKEYIDVVIEDRRLVILRLTHRSRGSSNDSVLLRGVRRWGLRCSTQGLRDDLRFLGQAGAVTLTDLEEGHMRVDITACGREVLSGDLIIGGITPPGHVRE